MLDIDPVIADALGRSVLSGVRLGRLEPLISRARIREVAIGACVSEGDCSSVALLLTGKALTYLTRDDGSRGFGGVLLPGKIAGLSLLFGHPSRTTVAIRDCEILRLDTGAFRRLCELDSGLALAVAEELARTSRAIFDRYENRLGVRERLVELLIELTAAGTAESMPITQGDLAELVGAARETVSRELAALRRIGAVTHVRSRVRMVDMRGIAAAPRERSGM